ncbi:MAG: extracellular solute-binding protein [Bacteroidales bacterium]|nr:extracellular solute-binding protein [Bacteroidales bacterium]
MKKLIILLFICLFIFSCQNPNDKKTIRIIHAGSLSLPVKLIVETYNNEFPDIEILTESWGSKAGARQISELKKDCDVFISADNIIIETFLMPEYASWSIPFAGNEMVLAYNSSSHFADSINDSNWYSILTREDVLTARSSPDADPCGVRAVMMLLLSDLYYQDPMISEILLEKDQNFIRPKEADLIALLEKNTVDYLYIYKSIAVQHHFEYLSLPDSINLSKPELSEYYALVSFETIGNTPESTYTETGTPIVYGITIPSIAKNKEGAIHFIQFFLDSEKGARILEENGQNILLPAKSKFKNNIPESLQSFLE